jgi:hypothetical protein
MALFNIILPSTSMFSIRLFSPVSTFVFFILAILCCIGYTIAGPSGRGLLRSRVRIPPEAWMFVCCMCCVLSGRGLCNELITRPEVSYRMWRVVVCDQETSWKRGGLSPRWAADPEKIINKKVTLLVSSLHSFLQLPFTTVLHTNIVLCTLFSLGFKLCSKFAAGNQVMFWDLRLWRCDTVKAGRHVEVQYAQEAYRSIHHGGVSRFLPGY